MNNLFEAIDRVLLLDQTYGNQMNFRIATLAEEEHLDSVLENIQ